MPRVKSKEIEEEIIDEQEFETPEYKTETFLKSFEASNEFTLTLYKHGANGKREIVTKYVNTIPDLIDDIQANYGGGTYEFYAYETVNGVKKFHAQKFNIAEPVTRRTVIDPDAAEEKALKRLMLYKEMFAGKNENTDNSSVMLKLMEMQQETANRIMEMQIKAQKEITDIVMSLKNSTSEKMGIKDLIEAYDLINDLKGEKEPAESSIIEKMLPALIPLIQNSGALNINKQAAPAAVPVQHTVIKDILSIEEIDSVISALSDDIKNSITHENKMLMVEKFHALNADKLSKSAVMQIIDRILLNRAS